VPARLACVFVRSAKAAYAHCCCFRLRTGYSSLPDLISPEFTKASLPAVGANALAADSAQDHVYEELEHDSLEPDPDVDMLPADGVSAEACQASSSSSSSNSTNAAVSSCSLPASANNSSSRTDVDSSDNSMNSVNGNCSGTDSDAECVAASLSDTDSCDLTTQVPPDALHQYARVSGTTTLCFHLHSIYRIALLLVSRSAC
jgi:hypothetical protein